MVNDFLNELLEDLLLELVEEFPNMPPIEKVKGEDTLMDAYVGGKFCQYCPKFATGCSNGPAMKARQARGDRLPTHEEQLIALIMKMPGMTRELIEQIAKQSGDDLIHAYATGAFCGHCPVFDTGCGNPPALQHLTNN